MHLSRNFPCKPANAFQQLFFTQHFREIKKGNIGLALQELVNKIRDSTGRKVDYGIMEERGGLVHPSLQVRARHCSSMFDSLGGLSQLCV